MEPTAEHVAGVGIIAMPSKIRSHQDKEGRVEGQDEIELRANASADIDADHAAADVAPSRYVLPAAFWSLAFIPVAVLCAYLGCHRGH